MNPFGIAPLLDRNVLCDPYVGVLVAKIRAGRYVPELWDSNSLYLNYDDRTGSSNVRAAWPAFKSRFRMTAEEKIAYRELSTDPVLVARREANRRERERERIAWEKHGRERIARAAAQAAEWKAEEERALVEQAAAQEREREKAEAVQAAAVQAEAAVQEAAVQEARAPKASATRLYREKAAILKAKWQCSTCAIAVVIQAEGDDYRLRCWFCGKTALVDHQRMNAFMAENAPGEAA